MRSEADIDVTLEVRYFAAAKAAAGTASEHYVCSSSDRISDLLKSLQNIYPALAAVLPRCSVLLDSVAVTTDRHVGTATTLDVLPPFAGG